MLGESYLIIPSGSLTDSSCQARRKQSVPGSSSLCPQSTTSHSHPHGSCFFLSAPEQPPLKVLVSTDTSASDSVGTRGTRGPVCTQPPACSQHTYFCLRNVRYVRSLLRVWLLSLNTMLWTALWVVFYTSLQILVVFSHYWVVFYCLDVAHFVLPFTSRKRLGCFQNACFVYNRFKLCKVGI